MVKSFIRTQSFGFLLTVACSSAAWACEGTTEYPKTEARLEATSLPAEQKATLMQKLAAGHRVHDDAHARDDKTAMAASLKTLAEVKAALPAQ
ncbi:MAG: hypothetical protein AB7G39_17825 [Alphaproteobacteria bacterium]